MTPKGFRAAVTDRTYTLTCLHPGCHETRSVARAAAPTARRWAKGHVRERHGLRAEVVR